MAVAVCGWIAVPMATRPQDVTCRLCRRHLVRELALGNAEGPAPAVFGARHLRGAGELAIEASKRPTRIDEPRPWRSPRHAIAAYVAHVSDGVAIASTSRPSRFMPVQGVDSDPGSRSDRVHGVAVAMTEAYSSPRVFGDLEVSREQQRTLLAWAHGGLSGSVTGSWARLDQLCDAARDRWGIELTERQASLIVRAGVRAVASRLRCRGEIEQREKEEDMKPLPTFDLRGWEQIAHVLGMSAPTAKRMVDRKPPLPVYEVDGVRGVHARRSELEAWVRAVANPIGSASAEALS